ncbi:MAG: hypothetical protein OXH96_11815 [Spirochaetaceae bacterium]|nr:hypothetical protein [Spirochaetaceae bacterium]
MKNAAEETPFERLRREERELRERLRSRGFRFAASDRLSREALHDRKRRERSTVTSFSRRSGSSPTRSE